MDLETARTIIAGARAHGQSAGFKPLTVVVLDAGDTSSPSSARTARR